MEKLSKIEVGNGIGPIAERFDAIIELVESGAPAKNACATHGIKLSTFQNYVLFDPAYRPRYFAAKSKGTVSKASAGNLSHADEILAQLEAGRSLRDICAGDSRFPHRQAFVRALDHRPELRDRYDAALDKWSAPHARSLIHFDEIERRIIAGGAMPDLLSTERTFPDSCSFRRFLKAHPDYQARYINALRAREVGPNARGVVRKYTEAEFREAAIELAKSTERYISNNRVTPNGPHYRTLKAARLKHSELCGVIEKAMLARITRLKIKAGPMFRPLTSGLVLPMRRTAPLVYEKFVLRRALSQNEIYAAVDAAVPKYFAPYDREDIIAQTVLEVIEDGIELEMIASVARETISAHFKSVRRSSKTKSLDAPVLTDSNLVLGDTISNGW